MSPLEIPAAAAVASGFDPEKRQLDHLLAVINHCTAAATHAESVGHPFLVHLLAMAILEAQTGPSQAKR